MELTPLTDLMEIDLAVNAAGKAYLFYRGEQELDFSYVEYHPDDKRLKFITEDGEVQDFGQDILPALSQNLQNSHHIRLVRMDQEYKWIKETEIAYQRVSI